MKLRKTPPGRDVTVAADDLQHRGAGGDLAVLLSRHRDNDPIAPLAGRRSSANSAPLARPSARRDFANDRPLPPRTRGDSYESVEASGRRFRLEPAEREPASSRALVARGRWHFPGLCVRFPDENSNGVGRRPFRHVVWHAITT